VKLAVLDLSWLELSLKTQYPKAWSVCHPSPKPYLTRRGKKDPANRGFAIPQNHLFDGRVIAAMAKRYRVNDTVARAAQDVSGQAKLAPQALH
jgi:hypothetical protein